MTGRALWHCRWVRRWKYADPAARDFVIGEKVSGRSRKQFLFWDLRSKRAIASGCNPRGVGCRVSIYSFKVVFEI
ncbi:MAG TPA: hypothetical protein VFQ47_09530, partial [Nitrososphaera sp.]|nr:hypothetical protein [Nitrososphaera sp.]